MLATLLSEGKTSRLYRALIDANLAINAGASKDFLHDPRLFTFTALLAPGIAHEQVEQTLLAEIEKLKKDGVTPAEVARAINQQLASIAYARDGSFAIAGQINECIAVGDWTLYLTQLEKLKAVTAADVQRVARKYFVADQSTTGWFIPQQEEAPAGTAPGAAASDKPNRAPARHARQVHYYREPGAQTLQAAAPTVQAAPPVAVAVADQPKISTAKPQTDGASVDAGSAAIAPRVVRRTLAGVDVLTLKTSLQDVVTIRGVLHAGDVFNPPENSAIADLTAGLLDKGTQQHDKFALAELLEQTGATIAFGTGTHTLNFSAKCLRRDLPLVLGLLAEQLRAPRFDPEEFAKLKKQLAGQHKRAMEDTDFRAERAFQRAIFPAGQGPTPLERSSPTFFASGNTER